MESIYTKLALCGSKKECARTENVFSPISEVCDGTVSLVILDKNIDNLILVKKLQCLLLCFGNGITKS